MNALRLLARLYGIQTSYYGVGGKRVEAKPEALLAALRAMGAPVQDNRDISAAVRRKRIVQWQELAQPVIVVWDQGPAAVELKIPVVRRGDRVSFRMTLEDGSRREGSRRSSSLPTLARKDVEGISYETKRLLLPGRLPWGYHRLSLEAAGRTATASLISSPRHAYTPSAYRKGAWGLFAPLYGLHSDRSWGAGDFTDLETLMRWMTTKGGGVVATLPFLAAFLNEPFDPSPYAPASRLFWNELYVDPTVTPEWRRAPNARKLTESPDFKADLERLRSASHVDYRLLYERKRRILETLSDSLHRSASPRREELENYVGSHPLLVDYARFRATMSKKGAPWPSWPSRQRTGVLTPGDYRERDVRFHLYAQWLAHQQVESLSRNARRHGAGLYLDLPLGVHPWGFEVWREQDIFVRDVHVGAPPDPVFTSGQDWGFHPLHPEASRRKGHRYWISSIRHQLECAGLLRIDHVMGLHRLFWIPEGLDFTDGVYVRYPVEELYAVLCLESHRNRSIIVGENLGIVPGYVNRAMSHHNIQQMFLMQYSLRPDPKRPMNSIPSGSVASLNTHDTPLFASFWHATDIEQRVELGLLDGDEARSERRRREACKKALVGHLKELGELPPPETKKDAMSAVLGACLARLRRSRAGIVLVNLEDLWLETEPQNIPGSGDSRSNWVRKLRWGFEQLVQRSDVNRVLRRVDSVARYPERRRSDSRRRGG